MIMMDETINRWMADVCVYVLGMMQRGVLSRHGFSAVHGVSAVLLSRMLTWMST